MIEYTKIQISEIGKLPEMGKENWITSIVLNGFIILYREKKKTVKEKKAEYTEEYMKFKEIYPKKD